MSTESLSPASRELRSFLTGKLPEVMIPSHYVWLQELPLTPSGKVDRQQLPDSAPIDSVSTTSLVAPRTPLEHQVANLWSQLLGRQQIGIHDNFFALGGHSLLAMQLLSRLRQIAHVDISLVHFFGAPTVAGLVHCLETSPMSEAAQTGAVPEPRAPACPVLAASVQEHLWLIEHALPGGPFFNIPYAIRLRGPLDVPALTQSVQEIVRRHETLRTTFAFRGGQLVQVIAPSLQIPLPVVDLQPVAATEHAARVQQLATAQARQPFDLAQGPLLRLQLVRLQEHEHVLLFTIHHIVSDGWSLGVLLHELAVLYDAYTAGEPSPLPALSMQYADFVRGQRQWQDNAAMHAQLAYWRQQLSAPLPVLTLPTDYPRSMAPALHTTRQTFAIPAALSQALTSLSARQGSTQFMVLVAAFNILLHSYTGQEDICVATLVANRRQPDTEALIGLLVNTVLLRTDLRGNPTGQQVLQRVRATTLAAYAHQELPFEALVQTLEQERQVARTSLCQVMLIWQNALLPPLPHITRTLTFMEADPHMLIPPRMLTTFDIILNLRDSAHGLIGSCIYQTALFTPATVNRMLHDVQHVLACLVAQPMQALHTFRPLADKASAALPAQEDRA